MYGDISMYLDVGWTYGGVAHSQVNVVNAVLIANADNGAT